MAFTCGFFNSIGHDRKYDARQFNTIFDGLITDGVYQSYLNEFNVTAAEADNTITVDTGRAWFNNTWNLNDSPENYELQPSDAAQDRIDVVVIEVNNERAVRDNDIKVIQGVPAEAPQKPSLINTELIHQYPLAYITRKAGINKVDQADIEKAVGTTECPYARLLYPYTPGGSSVLDDHIIYDPNADSLDFQVASLLQNGSPLNTGGSGEDSILFSNAWNRNNIYRGANIQSKFDDGSLYEVISNGTFEDLYLGDYFDITISTVYNSNEVVTCCIAGFNTLYDTGRQEDTFERNHVIIIPKKNFDKKHAMSSITDGEQSTADGYNGTDMCKTIIPNYSKGFEAVFGDHLLEHEVNITYITKTTAPSSSIPMRNGHTYGTTNIRTKLCLMTEIEVYGTTIWASSGFEHVGGFIQFPIFKVNPSFMRPRPTVTRQAEWWLRNIAFNGQFCLVEIDHSGSNAHYYSANHEFGVRPYFCLG